ncbi:hypothetical protein FHS27_003012 [Rhodopirellula rubra]|uniref:Uncharacterized protein n=1 Tax=Aporhodopirellula rubra TaxID=980271 RepID=A0A7W5E026_9BACT|nr:hypothetical protein [Aporhodopirellula rubra]MBB3207193.1 hypothetical protein [Aporhodopirellula rubra]
MSHPTGVIFLSLALEEKAASRSVLRRIGPVSGAFVRHAILPT